MAGIVPAIHRFQPASIETMKAAKAKQASI
jgi:hypothetical protein